MSSSGRQRVLQVVSDVFGTPINELDADSSPDTIEHWTSLTHINLLLALEAEFDTSISPEDTMEMLSVGLILTILEENKVLEKT